MGRDTKRIDRLLKNTLTNLALAREETSEGFDLGTVRNDLERHAHVYQQRLSDLKEFNAREVKPAPANEAKSSD